MDFSNINLALKPFKPHLFLSKPDGTIIAKLNEAFNMEYEMKLGGLSKVTFKMPYDIEIGHQLVRNQNIDVIKERYLLKLLYGEIEDWFVINDLSDQMDESNDIRSISAMSLGYELRDKIIRDYEAVSKNCTQVLTDALSGTIWGIGYIDGSFDIMYRSFSVSSKSVLDFLTELSDTFNAVIIWDNKNRKISFKKPDLVGIDKGLTFSYGKYVKTLSRETNADEMVTRFKAYGKDNLTFNDVNPSGTNYIEDFNYFLFPFERDANKNILSHSNYMSDSLCHALLDYDELMLVKSGEFSSLLTSRKNYIGQRDVLETELSDLKASLAMSKDNRDIRQSADRYVEHSFSHLSGTTTTSSSTLKGINVKFAVFAKILDNSGITVKYQGSNFNMPVQNKWYLVSKETLTTDKNIVFSINGTPNPSGGNNNLMYIGVLISDAEFTIVNNESDLIKKYVVDYNEVLVSNKNAGINAVTISINGIDSNMLILRNQISIQNNFTPSQITERNMFIIEREWTDSNFFNSQDLYNEAKKKFVDVKMPQLTIQTNIINFLESVECQQDWDKLSLGDYVTIEYDRFNMKVKAKIIEARINFDNFEINITIANFKDLDTEKNKLVELLHKSYSTSVSVDMNKFKWDGAATNISDISALLNNRWDAAKREIVAGVNESVTINERGLTILDPNDPNRFLRATHGVLGITNDGGATFKHAITAEGIIAERLFGQIIVGQNLTIGDETGSFNIVGNLLTVKDINNVTRVQLGEYETGKYGLKLISKNNNKTILDESGILQTWEVQEADNMDATHPVVLKIYLPVETASIRKAILNFSLEKFRTYSTGASFSGGGTVTSSSSPSSVVSSSSGGGTTATSSSGGGITATTASGGGTTPTSGGSTWFTQAGYTSGLDATNVSGSHNHGIVSNTRLATTADGTTVNGSTTFVQSGDHSHVININHNHTVTIPSHSHTVDVPAHTHNVTVLNHTHDVVVPSHAHNVDIPTHSHSLIYGIFESTTPLDLKVNINGTNRTVDLGGGTGWNGDMTNLDITSYLTIGQWNTIELSSSRLGRVNGVIFIQAFMNV